MIEIVARLRAAGQQHKGTDLGILLQGAALHIEMQNEALIDTQAELTEEETERIRLEGVLHKAQQEIETVFKTVRYGYREPVDISRDMSGHINLMAGHGDPDYLNKSGNSIRHIDCRTTKPRIKKESK